MSPFVSGEMGLSLYVRVTALPRVRAARIVGDVRAINQASSFDKQQNF